MTDIGIIMAGSSVRAMLREIERPGTGKTMTRRLAWRTRINEGGHIPDGGGGQMDYVEPHEERIGPSPWQKVKPGDRLWVRENWSHSGDAIWSIGDARMRGPSGVVYAADGGDGPWWPSIHIPKEFSRITLVVTATKIERLQEISEADALREGLTFPDGMEWGNNPKNAFRCLWSHLHGPGSWDANPEVVAVSFRPHLCNIDRMDKAA